MSWLTGREGVRGRHGSGASHGFLPANFTKPINISINEGNSNDGSNGIRFGGGSNNNAVNNAIGFKFDIDTVEGQILKVQAKERIDVDMKGEEAKIEALNREVKDYEQQLKALEHKLRDGCTLLQFNSMEEIERQKQLVEQRLHNLIRYESTLILTTSRGELLRDLDGDPIQLYGQRKELRQLGGHKDVVSLDHTDLERVEQRHASSSETRSRLQKNSGKLVIEGMANVSISSGISSGDDENREFIHNSNKRGNEKVRNLENYDFEGAVEEAHLLQKLKVHQMDMQDTSPQHDDFDAGKKKATKRTSRVTY